MPGSIKIDDGSGNYTILTNAGSLGSDKTLTIPNETATLVTTSGTDFSCQQFRLTANITASVDPITGFEVSDTLMQGNFGNNVTESSGTFLFTKTGFYKVSYISIIHTASTGTEGSIFIQ